jgi:phospholipid/cholesterol/gamma-HCH transport system substrate-binding protein
MLTVFLLGGSQSFFSKSARYTAHFSSVDGLIVGAKVILGGVSVGTVEDIQFDRENRNIQISFSVQKNAIDWIRQGSTVEIATQGVLGDKYISISSGNPDQPELPAGSDIPNRPTKDISQFITKGDHLLISLNSIASSLDRILKGFELENRSDTFFKGIASTAKNLSQAAEKMNDQLTDIHIKKTVTNLNQIFEKINNGSGTLGALVNDPGLYDEMRALMGGANRNRIIRNLVRQTIKESEEKNAAAQPAPSPSR